jgi:oligosaccharide repeat unit polymerase
LDTGIRLTISAGALLWWAFLLMVWYACRRAIGYAGLTTFTLFLPLTLATNGAFVPLARDLNYQITGLDISSYGQYRWALALMYLSLLLGIVLANRWRPRVVQPAPDLAECRVLGNPAGVKSYLVIVTAIGIISLLQICSRGLAFDMYSYATLKMDYGAYAAHRYGFAEATSGWEFFLYNKLPYGIAPVAIILAANARELARWKRVAFLVILALALLQTGHKMPLIFVAFYIAGSRAMIRWRFHLTARTIASLGAIFLIVLFLVVPLLYLMQGTESYGIALFWSVERIFLEGPRALQLYFEVYPDIHPFLHGASTRAVASLFGERHYLPPSIYIPAEVLGLTDTSFPTLFIGEAWADFGFLGVAAAALFVGFLLQLYNIWFHSCPRPKLEETALFLSIVFGVYHLQASNLLTSFFSYGLIGNMLIYLLIRRKMELETASVVTRSGLSSYEIAPSAS